MEKHFYRELTHTTWGLAGDDIRARHSLKRSRKLALYGWREKEEAIDKKTLAEDRMRDRWLDGLESSEPHVGVP
jgi:hypothetical protein